MTRRQHPFRFFVSLLAALCASVALGCGGSDEPKQPSTTTNGTTTNTTTNNSDPAGQGTPPAPPSKAGPPAGDPAKLAARGRGVYNANCIACHNSDPALDGGIGPAVAGASAELLEARIMRSEYPPGYTPKRDTALMVALPYLEPDLAALTAFLAQEN